MLLHVRIGGLEIPVWLGAVKEFAVDISVETSFKNRYVRGTLLSLGEIKLQNSRLFFISLISRSKKN